MQLDDALIFRLEKLARLQLTDAERSSLKHDLNAILVMIDKLHEVDTSGVAPMIHVNSESSEGRPDKAEPALPVEQVLRNAPDTHETFFRVFNVLKGQQKQYE